MAKPLPPRSISLRGVRQNNLKNVAVEIPSKKLTVITGLSGSGKSSLAFDTLYAEGQRRYIESLSTYTRQFLEKMPKPQLESIENIPPAVALEQRNTVVNSRSTVGTQTEVTDFLRILFAKLGQTECLECGGKVRNIDPQTVLQFALKWFVGKKGIIAAPFTPPPLPKTKKKKAKKKAKKKTTKKASPSSEESLFLTLREQGFRRLLHYVPAKGRRKAKGELIDLDDLGSPDFPKIDREALNTGDYYIVTDRLKIATKDKSSETRNRLFDSIEQALAIGHGEVLFVDFDSFESKSFKCQFACEDCGTEHRIPEPNLFSFNSPLGACENCSGFGHTLDLDEAKIVPDFNKTLRNGAIDPFSKPSLEDWQRALFRFSERHGISIGKRYRELTQKERRLLWEGDPVDDSFPGIEGCFDYLATKKYTLHVRVFIRRYQTPQICRECQGSRLQPEALAVKIRSKSIADANEMPIEELLNWFQKMKLSKTEKSTAHEVFDQIVKRLEFLDKVGVGYLTLDRLAKTLSGGEFQRINLASQLGNGLCGTLYVLDEPSIGLHSSDTERLIRVLCDLRDQGNTVVVVEHDLEMMRAADWMIELGPGAGRRGGEIVETNHADEIKSRGKSLTAQYLRGDRSIQVRNPKATEPKGWLKLTGCKENNLKNLTVQFPLERFVVVTGVSGSGKSTLVHKTLYESLGKFFAPRMGKNESEFNPGEHKYLYGAEFIRNVVLMDQKPIGKSSRSNPATYMKVWDEVRRIYANQVMSLRRGYTPQHFSFNVDGGRCPVCKGEGEVTLDMHFMADVKLPCEECEGKRFKSSILDVKYRGQSVHDLLSMTIDDAYDLFRDQTAISRKLSILRDVGLGYLAVGQSATTLSGGESQRLKIAHSIQDKSQERVLYLFDEPTTGLHQEDILKLMRVIQDLVESKNSVIMIEHHMDVIRQADWLIDLGPKGGKEGGHLLAAGTPEQVAENPKSVTGGLLREMGVSPTGDDSERVEFPSLNESTDQV